MKKLLITVALVLLPAIAFAETFRLGIGERWKWQSETTFVRDKELVAIAQLALPVKERGIKLFVQGERVCVREPNMTLFAGVVIGF